ncbi:hypothetical protein K2173_021143 [Erythroxylum novogranatense]|uniref:DUF7036 domain-containing protein n=1 Tax=Erythroxylum novogranatense TaxID=1862640 RepID=A0AAV8TPS1_9ROSI|nr:hypothetical protein K2173_021143 [Erythroxylum novogranatense]
MGKEEQLQLQQQSNGDGSGGDAGGPPHSSPILFCEACSLGLSRIYGHLSFRCVFLVLLSFSLLFSGIFLILPSHAPQSRDDSFDAKDSIKLSASVQSSFKLQKPVSQLVPHIGELEYDIYEEIGVPYSKVAILSMHQSGAFNWTNVVFGVLSDPINIPLNPVSLSVLRSSLIELFLQQSNLTLTNSTFGQPSMFEISLCPGGITIIPVQYAYIWQLPQILFNFTLNNSISDVLDNVIELKDQLKYGLRLMSYENVFVQLTNTAGSTTLPPVIVQASVMAGSGGLLPQRLKQLAKTISDSPAENLGLDNSVFGKVKGVILSSYLKGLHAASPTSSLPPSPDHGYYTKPAISPSPTSVPSLSPASSPHHIHPYATSPKSGPHKYAGIVNSPAPSSGTAKPPYPCPYDPPRFPPSSAPSHFHQAPNMHPVGPRSQLPPAFPPLPSTSSGPSPGKAAESPLLAPLQSTPSPSPSLSSSSDASHLYSGISLLGISGLWIVLLFCCQLHWL